MGIVKLPGCLAPVLSLYKRHRPCSSLSLQSTKFSQLLFCRTDHPRLKSHLFGDRKLSLRFGSFSQAKQSFNQSCTNPIFLRALYVFTFPPDAPFEQLSACFYDALSHTTSLNPVGDGVLAAKFRSAAV